jgi:membrane protease YdiL (CAAX protease family)
MSDDSSKDKLAGRTPWGPVAAALVVGTCFLVLSTVAGLLIFFLSRIVFGGDSIRSDIWLLNSPFAQFLQGFASYGLITLAIAWFVSYKRASFRNVVGLTRARWSAVLYAVGGYVVYFLLFIVAIAASRLLLQVDVEQRQALGFDEGVTGGALLLAFVSLVVLPPIVEELVFRGFLFGTFRAHRVSLVLSTLVTSIFFAGLHLFGGTDGSLLWIAFTDTFVLSCVLCYVREQTGSIWACIGIHAIKNGIVFLNLFILGTS